MATEARGGHGRMTANLSKALGIAMGVAAGVVASAATAQDAEGPLSRTHPFHDPGRPLPPPGGGEPEIESARPKHCFVQGHPNTNPDFQYSEDLSQACNDGTFEQMIPNLVKAWFDYGARQVPYGVANQAYNLRDEEGLAEPDEAYFFYRGPKDDCLVYVREKGSTKRLTCY